MERASLISEVKNSENGVVDVERHLPFLRWLPHYHRQYLPGDLIAGLTVATMLVPQSMAYALLAGLPPIVGLYASILPVIIYGFLGSTNLLTVGPTAITSVMVLGSISHLSGNSLEAHITLAITLAFVLGVVYLLMGLMRLDFIVNLLSRPVLTGYVNAAALIIAVSQVQHLAGISIERSPYPYELFIQTISGIGNLNLVTLGLGMGCVALLLFFKFNLNVFLERLSIHPVLRLTIVRSSPLLVVLLSATIVYLFRLDETAGVAVIGHIPAGFPSFTFGRLDFTHFEALIPAAVAIAFVGFMEGISTAKTLATRQRQRIDANQELFAMGAANFASAFTGGYPVTTSISRSAVNYETGARTGMSSVITGILLGVTVMFLTPLFYYLPKAALAAVIIISVLNLIDFGAIARLWQYSKSETMPLILTALLVFTISIEWGIISGMVLALLLHLWRTSRPNIAVLGQMEDSEHYRDLVYFDARPHEGVLIVRVDASLYFANAQYLENYLRRAIAERRDVNAIVLDCSAINAIDASALQILTDLIQEFSENGIEIYISELKERVIARLQRIRFCHTVGSSRFFVSTHEAIQAIRPDDAAILEDAQPTAKPAFWVR